MFFNFTLLFIGLIGVFVMRSDLIVVLISVELLLLASVLNFLVFSVFLGALIGQLFIIFILVIAAAETGIALSILVTYYQLTHITNIDLLEELKH